MHTTETYKDRMLEEGLKDRNMDSLNDSQLISLAKKGAEAGLAFHTKKLVEAVEEAYSGGTLREIKSYLSSYEEAHEYARTWEVNVSKYNDRKNKAIKKFEELNEKYLKNEASVQ